MSRTAWVTLLALVGVVVALHRGLDFGYGAAASSDDHAQRIATITDIATGGYGELARYGYAGTGRRVTTRLGYDASPGDSAVDLDLTGGSTSGYGLLDGHGRVADLHYTLGTTSGGGTVGDTVQRRQYAYDASGNRLREIVTQVSSSGLTTGYDNERSWAYEYDGLDRLIGAELGAWNGSAIVASSPIADPRITTWDLDSLGNWIGEVAPREGKTVTGEVVLGTTGGFERSVHVTDVRNEIDTLSFDDGVTLVETTFHHDASGNLVSDGEYFYQHDAWGRVVSVHEIGTYDPAQGTGALGDLICQFSYGGLGRLTRKLSPFPGFPNEYRTEHYYYDGVRRVQEAWSDPISAYSPFTSEEEEGLNPMSWTEREYLHGPGYVDEYVCQIDGSGRLAYILQDANYNVLALANDNGQVIEQLLWSPYGELLARESYLSFGLKKLGHQGLFFDRFDVPVTQSGLALQASGTPPDGLFYANNRSYSAKFGRFVQADPNGTAQPLILSIIANGQPMSSRNAAIALVTIYSDGMNVYAFGSAPITTTDPLGLNTAIEVGAVQGIFGMLAQAFAVGAKSAIAAAGSSQSLLWGAGLIGGAAIGYELADILNEISGGTDVVLKKEYDGLLVGEIIGRFERTADPPSAGRSRVEGNPQNDLERNRGRSTAWRAVGKDGKETPDRRAIPEVERDGDQSPHFNCDKQGAKRGRFAARFFQPVRHYGRLWLRVPRTKLCVHWCRCMLRRIRVDIRLGS